MIVDTLTPYNSSILLKNLNTLKQKYTFLKSDVIGYSVLGKPIHSVIIGTGKKQVFYFGAIHANEWIVTPVLMKFIEDFSIAYSLNSKIGGENASKIFNDVSIYIVPMVNPDGVDLVTGALSKNTASYIYAKDISIKYPSIPFPSGWKSNINGVEFINFHFFISKK